MKFIERAIRLYCALVESAAEVRPETLWRPDEVQAALAHDPDILRELEELPEAERTRTLRYTGALEPLDSLGTMWVFPTEEAAGRFSKEMEGAGWMADRYTGTIIHAHADDVAAMEAAASSLGGVRYDGPSITDSVKAIDSSLPWDMYCDGVPVHVVRECLLRGLSNVRGRLSESVIIKSEGTEDKFAGRLERWVQPRELVPGVPSLVAEALHIGGFLTDAHMAALLERERYTFHDADGNEVLNPYSGKPYTALGPRMAADLARELTQKLGYQVLWGDNYNESKLTEQGEENGAEPQGNTARDRGGVADVQPDQTAGGPAQSQSEPAQEPQAPTERVPDSEEGAPDGDIELPNGQKVPAEVLKQAFVKFLDRLKQKLEAGTEDGTPTPRGEEGEQAAEEEPAAEEQKPEPEEPVAQAQAAPQNNQAPQPPQGAPGGQPQAKPQESMEERRYTFTGPAFAISFTSREDFERLARKTDNLELEGIPLAMSGAERDPNQPPRDWRKPDVIPPGLLTIEIAPDAASPDVVRRVLGIIKRHGGSAERVYHTTESRKLGERNALGELVEAGDWKRMVMRDIGRGPWSVRDEGDSVRVLGDFVEVLVAMADAGWVGEGGNKYHKGGTRIVIDWQGRMDHAIIKPAVGYGMSGESRHADPQRSLFESREELRESGVSYSDVVGEIAGWVSQRMNGEALDALEWLVSSAQKERATDVAYHAGEALRELQRTGRTGPKFRELEELVGMLEHYQPPEEDDARRLYELYGAEYVTALVLERWLDEGMVNVPMVLPRGVRRRRQPVAEGTTGRLVKQRHGRLVVQTSEGVRVSCEPRAALLLREGYDTGAALAELEAGAPVMTVARKRLRSHLGEPVTVEGAAAAIGRGLSAAAKNPAVRKAAGHVAKAAVAHVAGKVAKKAAGGDKDKDKEKEGGEKKEAIAIVARHPKVQGLVRTALGIREAKDEDPEKPERTAEAPKGKADDTEGEKANTGNRKPAEGKKDGGVHTISTLKGDDKGGPKGVKQMEATEEEAEELQRYHDSISQDSSILKRTYRALFDFAGAVGHIDRAAKDGGPMVQAMRQNRLGMVKKRAGAHVQMMHDILQTIREAREAIDRCPQLCEQLDTGQEAEREAAAKGFADAADSLKKMRVAAFGLTTDDLVRLSSLMQAIGAKPAASQVEKIRTALAGLSDTIQKAADSLEKAHTAAGVGDAGAMQNGAEAPAETPPANGAENGNGEAPAPPANGENGAANGAPPANGEAPPPPNGNGAPQPAPESVQETAPDKFRKAQWIGERGGPFRKGQVVWVAPEEGRREVWVAEDPATRQGIYAHESNITYLEAEQGTFDAPEVPAAVLEVAMLRVLESHIPARIEEGTGPRDVATLIRGVCADLALTEAHIMELGRIARHGGSSGIFTVAVSSGDHATLAACHDPITDRLAADTGDGSSRRAPGALLLEVAAVLERKGHGELAEQVRGVVEGSYRPHVPSTPVTTHIINAIEQEGRRADLSWAEDSQIISAMAVAADFSGGKMNVVRSWLRKEMERRGLGDHPFADPFYRGPSYRGAP